MFSSEFDQAMGDEKGGSNIVGLAESDHIPPSLRDAIERALARRRIMASYDVDGHEGSYRVRFSTRTGDGSIRCQSTCFSHDASPDLVEAIAARVLKRLKRAVFPAS